MHTTMKTIILLMLSVVVSCVPTRDPTPVSLKTSADDEMACQRMAVEYRTNTHVAKEKIDKNMNEDVKDVVLGLLIWPGLADFKNADGTEGNALLDRNVYLRELALDKGCDVTDWPQQPPRYN